MRPDEVFFYGQLAMITLLLHGVFQHLTFDICHFLVSGHYLGLKPDFIN